MKPIIDAFKYIRNVFDCSTQDDRLKITPIKVEGFVIVGCCTGMVIAKSYPTIGAVILIGTLVLAFAVAVSIVYLPRIEDENMFSPEQHLEELLRQNEAYDARYSRYEESPMQAYMRVQSDRATYRETPAGHVSHALVYIMLIAPFFVGYHFGTLAAIGTFIGLFVITVGWAGVDNTDRCNRDIMGEFGTSNLRDAAAFKKYLERTYRIEPIFTSDTLRQFLQQEQFMRSNGHSLRRGFVHTQPPAPSDLDS